MKCLLKKIAFTLALTFGVTIVFTSTPAKATEINSILKKLDNYKEIIHDNGSITRIIEIPELNIKDEITYNQSTNKLLVNGTPINFQFPSNSDKYKELPSLKENFLRNSSSITWTFQIRTVRDIPIGTTVSTAVTLLSIWTKVPASRIAQTFLAFSGLTLSSILNDQLKLVIYQYRSKYPIAGRYKYKHSYLFSWKDNTFYKTQKEFFTERP